MKIKGKNIILICLIIIFILIMILVVGKNTSTVDEVASKFITNAIPESAHNILEIITTIGGTKVLPIIILIVGFTAIILKKEKYGLLILINSLLATGSYIIIKNVIQRPRPNPFRFIEETGYSFPSGHATNNMAFCGILIYLICKNVKNKKLKIISTILLSLWVLIIGISRIYFNVHYVSDLIAGFILGLICILISINIVLTNKNSKSTLNN